jgi:hypothetical protein
MPRRAASARQHYRGDAGDTSRGHDRHQPAHRARAVPWPVLAHGLRLDEDHLWQDLALNFGVPLLVLAVGALAGIGLSMWMNRHGAPTVDEADEAADLDEPIGHPGPR